MDERGYFLHSVPVSVLQTACGSRAIPFDHEYYEAPWKESIRQRAGLQEKNCARENWIATGPSSISLLDNWADFHWLDADGQEPFEFLDL